MFTSNDRLHKHKEGTAAALNSIKGIHFSPREIDIIACILGGRSTKRIATILNISSRTVETHIYNILAKIGSNSREGIIDFIERSDTYTLIKNHYTNLIIIDFFEDKLKKIAPLNKSTTECLLLYDDEDNPIEAKYKILTRHLDLCKIKATCIKYKEHLFEKNIDNIKFIILFLPRAIRIKPHAGEYTIHDEISKVLQKYHQTQIVVLHGYGKTIPAALPKNANLIYLNVNGKIEYCISFFNLLSRLDLGLDIDQFLTEFKNESSIQKENRDKNESDSSQKIQFNSEAEKAKWDIARWMALLSIIIIVILYFAFLKFEKKEEDVTGKSLTTTSYEINLINEEINDAIKQTDDLISSLDILDLKPRIILLNEDVDLYLTRHFKIEESLHHALKKLETLKSTAETLGGEYGSISNLMELFSNSRSYTTTMKIRMLNDLEIQAEIIKIVTSINNGLLLYMSNTNYPPDEKSTPNYDGIIKEFQKVLYKIHKLATRANSKKYLTYIDKIDTILDDYKTRDLLKKTDHTEKLTLGESQLDFLDKCFLIALNNTAMVLRTRGDIGESSPESILLFNACNEKFTHSSDLGPLKSKENITALCKFYVNNELAQKAYKKSLAIFKLSNHFREHNSLSVNYEPILLTQIGEVLKRLYNDGFNSIESINLDESINMHHQAYQKNTESIVVLNGYAKSLLDQIEKLILLNNEREKKAIITLNQINSNLRELGLPELTINENTSLESFMRNRNELNDKLFKMNHVTDREALIKNADSLISHLMERYQFKLDINKFFDIAERAFLYALQKCERGNAILEVNVAYLRFMKSQALNENSKASHEKTEEILRKIQGGKKDEHKTLLFHKATLQLKQKRYHDGLNTLHHYEYLGGNMNHPYLLYIRALLRFGAKDYVGANKDLARALEVTKLFKIYFKEKNLMPVIRFDEYYVRSDIFTNNICALIKEMNHQNGVTPNQDLINSYCEAK